MPKQYRIRKAGDHWEIARSQWVMSGGFYFINLGFVSSFPQAIQYLNNLQKGRAE